MRSPHPSCIDCYLETHKSVPAATVIDDDPLCTVHALKRGATAEEIEAGAIAPQTAKPAATEQANPDQDVSTRIKPDTKQRRRENAVNTTTASRICQGEDDGVKCTTPIGVNCTTGLCTRHYARMMYRKNHPQIGGGRKPRNPVKVHVKVVETTPARKAETVEPQEVGSLRVTEKQLNDFIINMPFQQRLEMVNEWLAR
jgi:hypothetical protein